MTTRHESTAESTFSVRGTTVRIVPAGLPSNYDEYTERADLTEELDRGESDLCCVLAGSTDGEWPTLVVALSRPPGFGFHPGVAFVPDTSTLFIGAGERLLAYRMDPPRRLWGDTTACGFYAWEVRDDLVLMVAELELAAWDLHGEKLWTTYVEPPWSHRVEGQTLHLDVMGTRSQFDLRSGPGERPGP